jgi:hypothetical protein
MELVMNLMIDQLRALLIEYKKLYMSAKEKYDDPEYLAWISANFVEDEWPTSGDFVLARRDPIFRSFRSKYMECRKTLESFRWDIIPKKTRAEYQGKWAKSHDGVPF